jgi:hypothetical protein
MLDGELDTSDSQTPLHLHGGFEKPLSNHPDIITFHAGSAGVVYHGEAQNGNLDYGCSAGDANKSTAYTPFSSKLDWKIACWAKMQGPGSNALAELLGIKGVRFSSYMNKLQYLLMALIRLLSASG